jgi:hypothetical protein
MNDNGRKQIDFKFAKNWKTFLTWHDAYVSKARVSPRWEDQTVKIQTCFESTNPKIVDWKSLWKSFAVWYEGVLKEKAIVLWAEQKRQIETLMLNQVNDMNKDCFVLAYLYRGVPRIDSTNMTYWDAVRTKQNLEGDKNGVGGDERMDKITIINLNNLIQ